MGGSEKDVQALRAELKALRANRLGKICRPVEAKRDYLTIGDRFPDYYTSWKEIAGVTGLHKIHAKLQFLRWARTDPEFPGELKMIGVYGHPWVKMEDFNRYVEEHRHDIKKRGRPRKAPPTIT